MRCNLNEWTLNMFDPWLLLACSVLAKSTRFKWSKSFDYCAPLYSEPHLLAQGTDGRHGRVHGQSKGFTGFHCSIVSLSPSAEGSHHSPFWSQSQDNISSVFQGFKIFQTGKTWMIHRKPVIWWPFYTIFGWFGPWFSGCQAAIEQFCSQPAFHVVVQSWLEEKRWSLQVNVTRSGSCDHEASCNHLMHSTEQRARLEYSRCKDCW